MSDAVALAQPLLTHDSDASPSEQISTDQAEELTRQKSLDTSGKEQLAQLLPPRSGLNLKSASKIALFMVIATSYLTFCFIVHRSRIPIGGTGFRVPGLPVHCEQYCYSANLPIPNLTTWRSLPVTTESGITTIAILIISVALWPIKGMVDEIKVCLIVHIVAINRPKCFILPCSLKNSFGFCSAIPTECLSILLMLSLLQLLDHLILFWRPSAAIARVSLHPLLQSR